MKCLRPYLPKSPVVLSGLAVLTILVGFVIFLWLIGIFDLPPTDAGPQALVAVIGLLGALATATIASLGILVKVTIDARSGERLKLEAAIQAVGLLSTSSGAEAPTSQKSGALFTLVELGQIGLALSLLENLWGGTNQLVASSACWVIGRGLESSDPSVQVRSARVLHQNAAKLKSAGVDLDWPLGLHWPAHIDPFARDDMVRALFSGRSIRRASHMVRESTQRRYRPFLSDQTG